MLLFPTENVRPVQVEALKHVASYIITFLHGLVLMDYLHTADLLQKFLTVQLIWSCILPKSVWFTPKNTTPFKWLKQLFSCRNFCNRSVTCEHILKVLNWSGIHTNMDLELHSLAKQRIVEKIKSSNSALSGPLFFCLTLVHSKQLK